MYYVANRTVNSLNLYSREKSEPRSSSTSSAASFSSIRQRTLIQHKNTCLKNNIHLCMRDQNFKISPTKIFLFFIWKKLRIKT